MTINPTLYDGLALGPNSDGQFQIGSTFATAGDMTNAASGMGVKLTAAAPFALAVYADDGGTAIASSWVSAGFFSYVNFAAQATGSAVALCGQNHIGANYTACDNVSGVYGITECDSAKTINAHVQGGQFGVVLSAGTVGASYVLAAISTAVNTTGATISGYKVHHWLSGGSGATADAAFMFGRPNNDMTGSGADKVADVSEDPLGHILVYLGSTLGYINVYSDAT